MAAHYLHLVPTLLPQLYQHIKLWLGLFACIVPFLFGGLRWGKAVD